MSFEIGLLLAILAAAMLLFSLERIPADIVAIGVLLSLILTGLLTPAQAFAGFGSDAVIMILGLLILSTALFETGVVERAGQIIVQRTGNNPNRLLQIIMGASSIISSVMSNTAATAFLVPVVLGISRRLRINPSRLLMPLAFTSILAGSVTLIGTSTNIVVSSLMVQAGMQPLGLFELTPVGLPILLLGLVYMYIIGRRMIPERPQVETRSGPPALKYLTELVLRPGSNWNGKTLAEIGLRETLDLEVVRVIRDQHTFMTPTPEIVLQDSDILLVEGPTDRILKVKSTAGVDIRADVELSDPADLSQDNALAEAVILVSSPLVGRSLQSYHFRERFGVRVMAINRGGETIRSKISKVSLRLGDVLLIEGDRFNIHALEDEHIIRIINAIDNRLPNVRNAPMAIIAFTAPIVLAGLEIVTFPVAVVLGVLFVFITRTISPEEAYRQVDWRAVILIGCMLALGIALNDTGAALYLAQQIVGLMGNTSPTVLLSVFFILTVILTQPMSNQAAAVVVSPIAFQTAIQLGLDPRPFGVMIALAASCSYLTPLEPSCLMVYSPGNYRFIDFLKVGSILTVLIYLLAIVLVPMIWPLG